jgi:hypothetical protein
MSTRRDFEMPFNLFKSGRSSTPKGNTVKKAEPMDGRQARMDFYDTDEKCDRSVVDLSTVSEWVNECALESSKATGRGKGAVLKELRGPYRATLVDEIAANDDIGNGQEAISEDCRQRTASKTDDAPKPEVLPMLHLLLGQQDPSSQHFTRKYATVPASTVPSVLSNKSSGSSPLALPDFDPHAFEVCQIWLQTGMVPSQHYVVCGNPPATDVEYTWQNLCTCSWRHSTSRPTYQRYHVRCKE